MTFQRSPYVPVFTTAHGRFRRQTFQVLYRVSGKALLFEAAKRLDDPLYSLERTTGCMASPYLIASRRSSISSFACSSVSSTAMRSRRRRENDGNLLHRHRQVLHAPGVADDEIAGRQDIGEIRLIAHHFAIQVLVLHDGVDHIFVDAPAGEDALARTAHATCAGSRRTWCDRAARTDNARRASG